MKEERVYLAVAYLIAISLGSLLIYTGIAKAAEPEAAVNAIRVGLGFTESPASTIIYCVVFGEIFLGAWLISSFRLRSSLWTAGGLFLLFAAWNTSFLVRGIKADCGCGFSASNPSLERGQWAATLKAFSLTAVAVVASLSHIRYTSSSLLRKETNT